MDIKENRPCIYVASDHAGFELKSYLLDYLQKNNIESSDLGCYSLQSVDYPDYAYKLVEHMKKSPLSIGILLCGSGIGMSIAANRFKMIRAALCTNSAMATLARTHNNANVLVMGARIINNETALECLEAFMKTEYTEKKYQTRIDKLSMGEC